MARVDRATEQALIDAVGYVVAGVEQGLSPTEATIKVAREHKLMPGAVQLVANAYNVAATNAQRQNGADLLSKTASCPLVDLAEATSQLWPAPAEAKQAALRTQAPQVSSDYSVPARAFSSLWEPQPEASKAAAAEPAPTTPTQSPSEILWRQRASYTDAKKAYEQARGKAAVLEHRYGQAMASLREQFKTAGGPTFADFATNAELLHGAAGELVVSQLRRDLGAVLDQQRHKVARFDAARGPLYALLDQVLTLAGEYGQAKSAADAAEQSMQAAYYKLLPAAEPAKPAPEFSLLDKEANFGTWAWATGNLANVANQMQTAADRHRAKEVQGYVNELTDPQHEQTLEDIRTQAMLKSFMLDDDVIGGYDPQEVMSAYNDLRQAAPQVATNPGQVRPLLRKRLEQGALADYDVAQLADISDKSHKSMPGMPSLGLANTSLI